jgi:uncharacterized damage-inducible protein DinB
MSKDVIRDVIAFGHRVTTVYLSDFADEELLVRPMPEMNHVAWQLGHLICSERTMMKRIDVPMPELPAGFAERYTAQTARSDDPKSFETKARYFGIWEGLRGATLTALGAMTEADLAEPTPESMHRYATTVAALFRHIGTHELMHAGQFTAVRRKLGKPVLI